MELILAPADLARQLEIGSHLDLAGLAAVYDPPPDAPRWVRVNMVSTLDGAATGADGVTGSINSPADKVVFDLLRALSDVVLIGAGTARAEGYGPLTVDPPYAALRAERGGSPMLPLALVTRSGRLPEGLRHSRSGEVVAITCTRCPELAALRADLGADHVIVAGDTDVDLPVALDALVDKGFRRIHSEGGPQLLGVLLQDGLVDEVCLTLSPHLVGGSHRRIVEGADLSLTTQPHTLIHAEGDLIGRWMVRR